MDIRKLQKIVVNALEDIKGEDIEVINTTKLTSLFDRVVIATGNSNRQVKALARSVHDKVKEAGGEIVGMEGEDAGEWVLVDVGDIVVHVMQPTVRSFYNLEELWQAKPKRAKTSSAETAEDGAAAAAEKKPRSRGVRATVASTAIKPATRTRMTRAKPKTTDDSGA